MIITKGPLKSQAQHLTTTAIVNPVTPTYNKVENIAVLTLKPATGGIDANGLEIGSDFEDFASYSQTPNELTTAQKIYYLYNIPATMLVTDAAFTDKLAEIFDANSTLIITSDLSESMKTDSSWASSAKIKPKENFIMLTMMDDDTTTWEPLKDLTGVGVFYSPDGSGEPLDVITTMTSANRTIISPMAASGRVYEGVTDPNQTKSLREMGFSFFIDSKEDKFGYAVFFGKLQYFTLMIYVQVEQAIKSASAEYLKDPSGQTFADLGMFQNVATNAATTALTRVGLVKDFVVFLPDVTQTDLESLNNGDVDTIKFDYSAERQQLHHNLSFVRN